MNNPTKTRRRFTVQQKQEAVALCLKEGLTCTAMAQRLELPNNSLAKWVQQARIDQGQHGSRAQGPLTSEERAELSRLRKEIRELRKEKDFFRLAAAHYGLRPTRLRLVDAKSSCRREVLPDRDPVRALLHCLAVQAAGCGPQRFLCLAATAAQTWPKGPRKRSHHGPSADGV